MRISIRHILGLAVLLTAGTATAQVTWLRQYEGTGVMVDHRSSSGGYSDNWESHYLTMFTGHLQAAPALQIIMQIPVSHATTGDHHFRYGSPHLSSTLVGNPYFGIDWAPKHRSSLIFQFGFRLPNVSDEYDNRRVAIASGLVLGEEQFDAFMPQRFLFQEAGGFQIVKHTDGYRMIWKTLIGTTFMKLESTDESELYADINSQFWFETGHFRFGGGGIARMILTEEYEMFADRLNINSGVSIVGVFGIWRPQVYATVPLTESLLRVLDFTYAIGLGVDF